MRFWRLAFLILKILVSLGTFSRKSALKIRKTSNKPPQKDVEENQARDGIISAGRDCYEAEYK